MIEDETKKKHEPIPIEINYPLLIQQKNYLITKRAKFNHMSTEYDIISGIIHLIDGIQDHAIASGIKESLVFGEHT